MASDQKQILLRRIRLWVVVFIAGLIVSGVTAIPLEWELNLAARVLVNSDAAKAESGLVKWVTRVQQGLRETYGKYPFVAYGTDWLAFGHFAIAICFIGAYRDPVRNAWLFTFGMIACWLVIPFALIFGGLRGIPFFWRLIDCSFGLFGLVPLYFCKRFLSQLAGLVDGQKAVQTDR